MRSAFYDLSATGRVVTDFRIGHISHDEDLRALSDADARKRVKVYRMRYVSAHRERKRKESERRVIERREQGLSVYEGRLGAAITLLMNRQPERSDDG